MFGRQRTEIGLCEGDGRETELTGSLSSRCERTCVSVHTQDLSLFPNQSRDQKRDVSAAAADVENAHASAYARIDQQSLRHVTGNVCHRSFRISHA